MCIIVDLSCTGTDRDTDVTQHGYIDITNLKNQRHGYVMDTNNKKNELVSELLQWLRKTQ